MIINYPYIPKDREIKYVTSENHFMNEAKKIAQQSGCKKQSTGAVVVQQGKIISSGCNAGKKVETCPRETKKYKTGEGYHLCKEVCNQKAHAEIDAINNAISSQAETNGANLYLYGHWWCCKNCWDVIIDAEISNVYLLENSHILFNMQNTKKKIYISGALTIINSEKNLKKIYENLSDICQEHNYTTYVPHLGGTDPIKNPAVTPKEVWEKDHHEVVTSDAILAYSGMPSLGVGGELEIARVTNSKIILWSFTGEKVSRLPLGNPAVLSHIIAENEDDLYHKVRKEISEIQL